MIELTGFSECSFMNVSVPAGDFVVERVSRGEYTVTLAHPLDEWMGEILARAMGLLKHRKRRVRKKRTARATSIWRKVGRRRRDAHDRWWPAADVQGDPR